MYLELLCMYVHRKGYLTTLRGFKLQVSYLLIFEARIASFHYSEVSCGELVPPQS